MNYVKQTTLARELGVCDRTIRNWIKQGKVEVVRVGERNRIPEKAEGSGDNPRAPVDGRLRIA